jgi:hypothetical protein
MTLKTFMCRDGSWGDVPPDSPPRRPPNLWPWRLIGWIIGWGLAGLTFNVHRCPPMSNDAAGAKVEAVTMTTHDRTCASRVCRFSIGGNGGRIGGIGGKHFCNLAVSC